MKVLSLSTNFEFFEINIWRVRIGGVITRVRNWGIRVCENLFISFFRSAWTGEGERKNDSKFTDFNAPISEYGKEEYSKIHLLLNSPSLRALHY